MEDTAEDKDNMTSQQELCISDQMTSKRPISTLKVLKLSERTFLFYLGEKVSSLK